VRASHGQKRDGYRAEAAANELDDGRLRGSHEVDHHQPEPTQVISLLVTSLGFSNVFKPIFQNRRQVSFDVWGD